MIRKTLLLPLLVILCLFSSTQLSQQKASALSGADFNPSRIIDDAVFFNPNAMNAGDIQTFLNSKVPVCDTNGTQPYAGTTRAAYSIALGHNPPFICLKDYTQSVPAMTGDTYCNGSVSAGVKSAAQIIYDVAQACGVSPKVLIILLQKEQGLVTDDWPWETQYRAATGYGCPDTASCDSFFAGFFNQVYYAARQYQRYVKQANLFNFRPGVASNIQYNPNTACGSSSVTIQNQATAGLYNYTPYQPNAAALANLYGTGDGCSAYGNRNFWRMYIDWFGSPNSNVPFAWSFEGQTAYSDSAYTQPFTSTPTAVPGGKIYMRIRARNMGNQPWDQSFMHIGGSRPIDRASQFADPTWLSNTRPTQLSEAVIQPGEIGTFDFTMLAPATTGTYNEYFNLVAEGHTWLNDLGLYYTINVNTISTPSASNNSMSSGQSIAKDEFLLSPDLQSVLTVQGDGGVALYSNGRKIWGTGTIGNGANRLIMQADGNLVLYSGNGVALWSSQTDGNPGARIVLQTDGNVVIYTVGNVALWSTSTVSNPDHLSNINNTLSTGRLYPGQGIDTADRRFHLMLQPDGNLVLYSPTRALWSTATDGKSVAFLALQDDGNLVLYAKSGKPLWYSGTRGNTLRLVAQPDGNLVIYNQLNFPLWNTATAGAL